MASANCLMTSKMLPSAFCWTRFGVEAGQEIAEILERKETERRANGGVFLWGIGNSIVPSLNDLLAVTDTPKAVFSPIRTRPRPVDKAADAVAVWTRARTPRGMPWALPPHSMVTSHVGRALGRHFALVCRSPHTLRLSEDGPTFAMDDLRNLRSDRLVGASQVTAIVRHQPLGRDTEIIRSAEGGSIYAATMVVDLVPPYVVILDAPTVVHAAGCRGDEFIRACWDVRLHSAPLAGAAHQYDFFE